MACKWGSLSTYYLSSRLKNRRKSNWMISPGRGKTCLSCHQPVVDWMNKMLQWRQRERISCGKETIGIEIGYRIEWESRVLQQTYKWDKGPFAKHALPGPELFTKSLQRCKSCLQSNTSWWFQTIWKTCPSNWIISPRFRGENFKKNLWVATS